ncbi:hypothetical protein [Methanospirillum sp.]|uniref:hypothetical protein n=1 Tax=Methanospirillum sp. TaxID=45200 RepID=UPI002D8000F2|nr:hypothetical protein [Methanospirillum sp.]
MTDLDTIFDLRREQKETPTLIPLPQGFRLKFERALMDLKNEYRSSGDEILKERIDALSTSFQELLDARAEIIWQLGYSATSDPNFTIDEESAFNHLKNASYILRGEAWAKFI